MIGCLGIRSSLVQALTSGLGLLLLLHSAGVSAQASEAGLRVAFVYNFLKFIEWPSAEGKELKVCALRAQDTTRESLAQLDNKQLRTTSTSGNPIKVVFLDEPDGIEDRLSQCHLVYVPLSGAAMPLPSAMPAGILLVADEPNPSDARVSIALTRNRQDRIEFSINDDAVKQAGVKISSQLRKLAKNKSGGAS